MELKEKLKEATRAYVEERTKKIHVAIADLEEALKLETKCSMGDKYETGRAMLHLEFEKLSSQLEQYGRLKKTVSQIPEKRHFEKVEFGSVVKTTKANYFISIPAGEIIVNADKYYAIGAGSPIAQILLGKKAGDIFDFNGSKNSILEVI